MLSHITGPRCALVVALALVTALGACSSDSSDAADSSAVTVAASEDSTDPTRAPTAGESSTAGTTASSSATPAADASAFPVTIQHALGSTTITSEPTRVVTVGLTDHEILLALGIVPVGVSAWFGPDIDATWPWVADRWNGTTPTYVNSVEGYNFEQIAALEPDLILGMYAGLDASEYAKLSAIAPTVAQSADYDAYTTPWTEMTLTAGRALGRSAETEALVAGIADSFAAVRAAHPEFAEQTTAVVDANDGEFWVFASGDPRATFMTELGFQPSAPLDAAIGDIFGMQLPTERLDLLDVDRLIVLADTANLAALETNALYQTLAVVGDGRTVEVPYSYTGPEEGLPSIGSAMSYNSVLSIPYALEQMELLLAAG